MAKNKSKEVVVEDETSAAAPSETTSEDTSMQNDVTTETTSEAVKVTQSTKEVEVEVIKDFKGLKAGDKVTVSANIAQLLTNKGLVK